MRFGISAWCPVHNQALVGTIDHAVVSISSRQGDATLVPYHHWAHGFQSATGGPGPKRASTCFCPLSIELFQ